MIDPCQREVPSPALRPFLFTVFALAMNGCSLWSKQTTQWPGDIPHETYFERSYAADLTNQKFQTRDTYLNWVFRFYRGWALYPIGWTEMSSKVLAASSPDSRSNIARRLDALGHRIAGEWAKSSPQRLIFNDTVAVWGEAIAEAAERGDIPDFLSAVESDVDSLFDRSIKADVIVIDRYYEIVEFDPFALPQ